MNPQKLLRSIYLIIWLIIVALLPINAGSTTLSDSINSSARIKPQTKNIPLSSVPKEVVSDWMSTIRQDIQQREYHFHFGPARLQQSEKKIWQAPNRKQDLRIYADENGIEILERTGAGEGLLQLKTVAFGRSGSMQSIKPGNITVHENRLEIQRDALTEWYVNNEKGIEQGFVLPHRIAGDGALSIVLKCKQQPVLIDKIHLLLHSKTGRLLNYSKLLVTDAAGEKISARFTLLANSRFGIEVDDRGASYPLTVDPIITSTYDTLLAGDQINEYFGTSVANAGDVNGDGYSDIIVGAPNFDNGQNNQGAVFLFIGGNNGLAPDPAYYWAGESAGLQFGSALAGAGDINGDGKDDFVAGSRETYPTNQGSAIVYYGDSDLTDGLSYSSTIVGNGVNDKFAASVSGAGDVNGDGYADILIGAPAYGRGTTIAEGRAYLFYGSSYGIDTFGVDDFSFQNTGQGIDHSSYHFGSTVAGGGDINGDGYADILVATDRNDTGTTNEVYIYFGSSSGISTEPADSARLISPQTDSDFGKGLAMTGDLNGDGFGDLVIGAPDYDADGLTNQGAIFVHFGSSTGLSSTLPALAFKSNGNGARLGSTVSGGGDINGDGYSDIVAGAAGYQLGNGAVYIYHGHAGGLHFSSTVQLAYIGSEFGADVDITGDVNGDGYADLVAGAPLLGVNQVSHCGAVFVFHGSANLMDNTPDFFLESNKANAHFGSSVSDVGDFNGDGFDDIVVGAPYYDKGQGNTGMAFLYYGPPGGLLWYFPLQFGNDVTGVQFGNSVSGAGDVNGDGFDDVVVGQYKVNEVAKVHVYYGDSLLNFPPKTILGGPSAIDSSLGASVSGAGDVNGDGFADIVTTNFNISVYYGSVHGISGTHVDRLQDIGGTLPVAGAGDVNGDGYTDILVGYSQYDNGENNEGAVYVYFGSPKGITLLHNHILESNVVNARMGRSISGAGDVNGDGFDDVIAGAYMYTNGQPEEGAGFLFLGGPAGPGSTPPIVLEGDDAYRYFGRNVSGAGDVNADGFDDILIGGDWNVTRLYLGTLSGVASSSPMDFNISFSGLNTVSGAGDINGDGFADIIIGAHNYDHGQAYEGAVFLYLGSSNGRPVRTTFLRKDGSHPIASRGLSYDKSGFQLRMDLHSPRSKEKIRIETLICPEIQPPPGVFNTCDTFISPWQDAMANYSFTISGLTSGLYFVQTRLGYAPYAAVTQGIYQPAHLCANDTPCLSSRHTPWRYLHGDRSTSVVRIGMPRSKIFWPMFLPAILSDRE